MRQTLPPSASWSRGAWRVLGAAQGQQRWGGVSPCWGSSAAGRLTRAGRGPPDVVVFLGGVHFRVPGAGEPMAPEGSTANAQTSEGEGGVLELQLKFPPVFHAARTPQFLVPLLGRRRRPSPPAPGAPSSTRPSLRRGRRGSLAPTQANRVCAGRQGRLGAPQGQLSGAGLTACSAPGSPSAGAQGGPGTACERAPHP